MIRKYMLGFAVAGLTSLGLLASNAAQAAYTVTNDLGTSSVLVSSSVSPIASTQTTSILAGNISGALGGGFTGSGTFSPAGGGGGTIVAPGANTTSMNTDRQYNTREAGRAAGAGDKKFGAWVQGAYSSVENSQIGAQFDGSVYNGLIGLDYSVSDRAVVGLALGYETADIDTSFNRGKIESNGFTVSPYVGFALNNTWSVSLLGGYSWLTYDVTRNTNVTASYDAERWFTAASLDGNYGFGRVSVRPTVGVLYLEEKGDAFRDSSGSQSLESKSKLGRITAGATVGYAFAKVMPYVKLIGEYDFEKNPATDLGNGSFSHVEDFGGKVGAGLQFFASNSVSGNIETSYNSLGREDMDVWSTSARLSLRF